MNSGASIPPYATGLPCEAGGCPASIPAREPDGPNEEPRWTFFRVPAGWDVTWAICDGKGAPAVSRMVVLCPLHGPKGSA